MSDFIIDASWTKSDDKNAILKKTTADLSIEANGVFLTQNINSWTKRIEDTVRVSVYPLAKWFSYYWWRLENEFSNIAETKPDYNWKAAHELGAADNGYVWPFIVFISDGRFINIINDIKPSPHQSVTYVGKISSVQSVPIVVFQKQVSKLIELTIERVKDIDSDLVELWSIVCEDMNDPKMSNIRRLEAVLGFDPEECPDETIDQVLNFQQIVGASSIMEVASDLRSNPELQSVLQTSKGIVCDPQIKHEDISIELNSSVLPWQYGVRTAHEVRKHFGLGDGPISNKVLLDMLGIRVDGFNDYNSYSSKIPVSVGRNNEDGKFTFIPREKGYESNQRFEFSRLLGDALLSDKSTQEWLIASDCKSFRQKYQRAFAAEFLCPLESIENYLEGDYSEQKREEAASYFQVSGLAVNSILINNGKIERTALF